MESRHPHAYARSTAPGEAAITFEEFMADALYGPSGFYTSGGFAGRRGDFLTSPEVGPLFGAVIARYLDAEWRKLGEPARFTVVEAGAGPGTLARAVSAASPDCSAALHYTAVEVSDAQRARHPAGIESVATMPDGPIDGVVIANELLDNLPFRLAVFDSGWREAYVERTRDGSFVERLGGRFDPPCAVLPKTAAHGARAPLVDQASRWVTDTLRRLRRGSLIVLEYGVGTTAELANRPWRDWLRTYRGNERGSHYLRDAGRQDITTDVPFDQLPTSDSVRSQSQFLQLHGIDDLVEEGRRHWKRHSATPDLQAMKMRSRISEAEALLDPDGLGAFVVAEWSP